MNDPVDHRRGHGLVSEDPAPATEPTAVYGVLDAIGEGAAVPITDIPKLGFDHNHIVSTCLPLLGEKLFVDMAFTKALLPAQFTTRDARAAQEQLTGERVHMGNLNRTLDQTGAAKVGHVSTGPGRPAALRTYAQ